MTVFATLTARSLLEPITKFFRVYLGLIPVLKCWRVFLAVTGVGRDLRALVMEISRPAVERLALALFWTVYSMVLKSILLCFRAVFMWLLYFVSICFCLKTLGTPIKTVPLLIEIKVTPENQVAKAAGSIVCSTSAKTFFQTSNT